MSNPTQVQPDTSANTSSDSQTKKRSRAKPVATNIHDSKSNAFAAVSRQQIAEFFNDIMIAKHNNDEWVEVPQEVVDHFNPTGLGGADHFIYEGVKVCVTGTLDNVLDEFDATAESKLHPYEREKL